MYQPLPFRGRSVFDGKKLLLIDTRESARDDLEQKKMELERVRREIEALHLVIPLLAEDVDWIDNWLALPASQFLGSAS